MEIYLIRHTTPAIVKGTIYGQTDVALADSFIEEKEAIIRKLPHGISPVFSSPSTRCRQLASFISDSYQTDKRLYELNFGKWEGKTWDTIDRNESDLWMQDFVNIAPPGGESMLQMQERVMSFWQELVQQPYKKVAVVTHAGVIRIILAAIEDIPLKSSFKIPVDFCDIIFKSVPFLTQSK